MRHRSSCPFEKTDSAFLIRDTLCPYLTFAFLLITHKQRGIHYTFAAVIVRKRNTRHRRKFQVRFHVEVSVVVITHFPFVQRLALTLAVLLLVGPVGTFLAQCVSGGAGEHDQKSAPAEQVVAAGHMHDCHSSGEIAVDLDPAVKLDPRRSLLLKDASFGEEHAVSLRFSSRPETFLRNRASPHRHTLHLSLRSVRTVVLLV